MGILIDIGEVREITGLSASALRFYEERGLIESAGRAGLRRQYRPTVVERLAVVVLCRDAGFTIDEIGALLATKGEPEWKAIARAKADVLRSNAERQLALATQLEHALHCPSRNVMQCSHFRDELAAVFANDSPDAA